MMNNTLTSAEELLVSKPVQQVLATVAVAIKWGKVTIEIKDGRVVMSRLEKDIKHS